MSNFLDLRCPECGREDCIDILAEIWVRATEDGTDPDQAGVRDRGYTPRSSVRCCACAHEARLADFEPPEEQPGAP